MERNTKIKLITSIAGLVFAIGLGSFFFVPILNNNSREINKAPRQRNIKINFDSLFTILLVDTTTSFRHVIDSLIQNKCKNIKQKQKQKKSK
jgi:hypothetical protein